MRVVFIGSVKISLSALSKLVDLGAELTGVCTLESSKFNTDHVDLRPFSVANGIPTFYCKDINSFESISWIKDKEPDIIFCIGWSQLIKAPLLNLAPMGVVGFHPAELPQNRGRHPIIWALALGLHKTASTFFFMNEGADSGDLLMQHAIPIDADDDAGTLYNKITDVLLHQIEIIFPKLQSQTYTRIKQNNTRANIWRKRGEKDGNIDWRMSSESVHNLVRALARPYLGAHFLLNGKKFKVWKSVVINDVPINLEPGKVLSIVDQTILVKCGTGAIKILEMEPFLDINVGEYL